MSDGEPLIFELDAGPSFLGLLLQQIVKVNYIQFPIIFLLVFHIGWAFLLFKLKNSLIASSAQFLASCFFIYVSATVNSFFSRHWESFFFHENYFDPNCIFIFVFWALPFTLAALFIIFSLFVDLCKSVAVHRYFDSIISNHINSKGTAKGRDKESCEKEAAKHEDNGKQKTE
ncbi:hypothetical protein TRFO_41799 [Tritrichomonas foetus]|uniref:Uncharacterized protein n=1 Tax=Tritrichomonas foetus TaxID=1144522 RepID=A0A1J4L3G6_9EUKA|nr:hypothetical protein TRFO_41799 [Tritrichomonas foetus]|eukprot:OHT16494.1 hypothetical protein TRFO_41799 [Tritrichomonas foetus]